MKSMNWIFNPVTLIVLLLVAGNAKVQGEYGGSCHGDMVFGNETHYYGTTGSGCSDGAVCGDATASQAKDGKGPDVHVPLPVDSTKPGKCVCPKDKPYWRRISTPSRSVDECSEKSRAKITSSLILTTIGSFGLVIVCGLF